jgi:hypothetical protein
MQPYSQHVHPPQPRVFNYSLDWRFLLPIANAAKIRVIVDDEADLSQTLERVGIPVSNQLSFSSFKQIQRNNTQSLVIPFGLAVHWVGIKYADQIEFYRSIRGLIDPDGYLLVGFYNTLNFRSNTQSKYHSSTPRRIRHQLHQAGFKSIKIFGAIPNLNIPDYIFGLESQPIYFALRHRFRQKPIIRNALKVLAQTIGLARISSFLPCYFVVATV